MALVAPAGRSPVSAVVSDWRENVGSLIVSTSFNLGDALAIPHRPGADTNATAAGAGRAGHPPPRTRQTRADVALTSVALEITWSTMP
ncbi:hypothetical protein Ani05nite_69980 [Amorphoplanes nipponensis]|uniref:Uncharacterized protein n=1 Tax=Actinoplanes nipponensis TaxID=135950 RepID=A0A919ML15_9ACTN|nr:hypothetical protein Ani05nite_69980 [Actinoplanes nipponensis]